VGFEIVVQSFHSDEIGLGVFQLVQAAMGFALNYHYLNLMLKVHPKKLSLCLEQIYYVQQAPFFLQLKLDSTQPVDGGNLCIKYCCSLGLVVLVFRVH